MWVFAFGTTYLIILNYSMTLFQKTGNGIRLDVYSDNQVIYLSSPIRARYVIIWASLRGMDDCINFELIGCSKSGNIHLVAIKVYILYILDSVIVIR